jgi:hypothetical protein
MTGVVAFVAAVIVTVALHSRPASAGVASVPLLMAGAIAFAVSSAYSRTSPVTRVRAGSAMTACVGVAALAGLLVLLA